jgi:hypothetical protein
MGRATVVLLFVLSLLPSAYLAWQGRDLPHLGSFHDDAIYFETARNLAFDNTYRIGSLPWTPFQTKYPPLYPLYLSIAWRITPVLEDALPIAMFLHWLWLPVWMLGIRRLLLTAGTTPSLALAVPLLVAIHPEVQIASTRLMSDLMFAAIATWALAIPNPALPAIAYLVRTAALPLMAATTLVDFWDRKYRRAAISLATACVPIVAWAAWVATHRHIATNTTERYYTDYFAYQLEIVPIAQLPDHLYQQLDPLVAAISRMMLLNFGDSFGWIMLNRITAIAAISGIIRLVRKGQFRAFAAYSLLASVMMLVWYFPPDTRALLPLLPLLMLGFWTEATSFAAVVLAAWNKGSADRVFACLCLLICVLVPVGMLLNAKQSLAINGNAVFIMERRFLNDTRQAYRWIETNTPASARFFTVDDPAFALYTKRQALRIPQLDQIYTPTQSQEFSPSRQVLEAMDHFDLDCLFVSIKHFNPDPQNPHQPLRFTVESSGLKQVYRTKTELAACRP